MGEHPLQSFPLSLREWDSGDFRMRRVEGVKISGRVGVVPSTGGPQRDLPVRAREDGGGGE